MNVPFCTHCFDEWILAIGPNDRGLTKEVLAQRLMEHHKELPRESFPLYCDKCGFITHLVTYEQLAARFRAAGLPPVEQIGVGPQDELILFVEEPEAKA